ncbi:site-specific integrase [Streptomyces carminius]|uniref:Site-specific integrase n=1 Tax=Streptomyces carminius TaxID=2665496 RepID=A0A2M8LXB3_9ACTN|nr:site-specific integrase [Streptomyces carminius]
MQPAPPLAPVVPAPSARPATRTLKGAEAAALLRRFPPRTPASTWPMTEATSEYLLHSIQRPPLCAPGESAQAVREIGARVLLQWLQTFPGATWQERWQASPAVTWSGQELIEGVRAWARTIGRSPTPSTVRSGVLALICADAIRPDAAWLSRYPSKHLRPAIAAARDAEGFARLQAAIPQSGRRKSDGLLALAQILVMHGGKIEEIVVGDFLARLREVPRHQSGPVRLAYSWLRGIGQFPSNAPVTLRLIENRSGQVTPAELVDRYHLQCKPVRDLIVDYLSERQPSIDYNSLKLLSTNLSRLFWADLEQHHPGINSLRLSPDMAAAWKARLAVKTVRRRRPDGTVGEVTGPRASAPSVMMAVRAFYLDIGHWALEEPERWGPWAVPSPVSEADCSVKKLEQQVKARMDQRTRERLPYLPALVRVADRRLKEASERLAALVRAPLGSTFTVLGETFTAPKTTSRADGQATTVHDVQGRRRDLRTEEKRAFWAWATIEILRHTGIRIEELLELGHHSIISYKLPTTGEIIPLLQIAPSKIDQERLLLISPELADVLSAVITRVRQKYGTVPVVPSYDHQERVWNDPLPLLYQWQVSEEHRPVSVNTVRQSLNETMTAAGLTDASGAPLNFQPHDFRRIFITDAILNGLPPHIAQVIAGHGNINTTMGYNAIYPAKAIEAHRAFIARRRALRPVEEYRAVTPEEWQEFLGHFARRKLALGDCGRAYGTDCIHEHACIRCPVLIVDFSELSRLVEVRDNLTDRIAEAEREGWFGEVEQLSVSRTAAEEKIAQLESRKNRKDSPVFLGTPSFDQLIARDSEADATEST